MLWSSKISRLKNSSQRGLGKITIIFFGSIFAVVAYCAWHILPFYYCYFELQNHFQTIIRIASTETDQEIRARLWQHIRTLQIPGVKPEDLKIEREDGVMRIRLKYEEIFYVTWKGKDYELHVFPFDAYAEGKY